GRRPLLRAHQPGRDGRARGRGVGGHRGGGGALMAAVPVLCFPYAGAGASVYRRCQEIEASGIRISPVQLPGRAELSAEALCTDAAEAVQAMLPQILDLA